MNSEFKKISKQKIKENVNLRKKKWKKMEGSLMAERKVQIRPDLLLAKAIQQKLQPEKKKFC